MELYDVMRTTFAAREFTADPMPDDVLARILDHARFAPSGGNRQGWKVIVVREQTTKDELARLSVRLLSGSGNRTLLRRLRHTESLSQRVR